MGLARKILKTVLETTLRTQETFLSFCEATKSGHFYYLCQCKKNLHLLTWLVVTHYLLKIRRKRKNEGCFYAKNKKLAPLKQKQKKLMQNNNFFCVEFSKKTNYFEWKLHFSFKNETKHDNWFLRYPPLSIRCALLMLVIMLSKNKNDMQ
jgi:hypothetical protein